MRAGPMRHLVRLQQRVVTQDAAGERTLDWQHVLERRAAIQRTPGSEQLDAAQRQARVPTIFRLRYPRELTTPVGNPVSPDMRLICDGRVYDIVSVIDESGLKEELVITALERVGEAP